MVNNNIKIRVSCFDRSEDKFRVLGNLAIGFGEHGNNTQLGTGGEYTRDTVVLTTNDNISFTDITNSPIKTLFVDTTTTTSVYFGNTKEQSWYGLTYTMSTDKITSEAEVIWEYYDNGATDWVEVYVMHTSNNGECSIVPNWSGDEDALYDYRFDQDIEVYGNHTANHFATSWSTSVINGISAKWIRCRLINPGTGGFVSPKLKNNITFHGSHTTINNNGLISKHGLARIRKETDLVPYIYDGNVTNSAVDICQVIKSPSWTFHSSSDGSVYVIFKMLSEMDMSCGIIIGFAYYVTAPGNNLQNAEFTYYINAVDYNSGNDIIGLGMLTGLSTQTLSITPSTTDANVAHRTRFHGPEAYGNVHHIDISRFSCNHILYVKIQRNGSTDSYIGDIVVTKFWLNYSSWQEGLSSEVI